MLEKLLKSFDLSVEKLNKLNKLKNEVIEYNKMVNLTSITDDNEFNIKHILDSISIVNYFDLNNKNILDVGSGAGFPGLVLAIVFPNSNITMLDSNNKKINFINLISKKLKIKNCSTIYSRVEETEIDENYDIVIARAVSSLNILLELTSFASKINGKLIFYKGTNVEDEMPKDLSLVFEELGLKLENIKKFNLTKDIKRSFVCFKKTKSTKSIYPRIYSTIKNNPIY